ncbi:MAG: squalene--hopene cyclase [Bacillus sp. (in: Bacteria)]|nr:squalene--hopene cyclase [Bacillus sp. (in: firmicutes)]
MKEAVEAEISRLVSQIKEDQNPDGSWSHCFETSVAIDAYMIILLKSLRWDDNDLIRKLVRRIEDKQSNHGSWKAYPDEQGGNLSLTIEAYYALLASGVRKKTDENMKKAEVFITGKGGLKEATTLTKVILAVTGQLPWPKFIPIPIEFLLLPPTAPISFYDFSGYARVHITPMLVVADRKFVLKMPESADLSHLNLQRDGGEDWFFQKRSHESRSCVEYIEHTVKKLIGLPKELHEKGLKRAEKFMLKRIEKDGTLYSYFIPTFLMIYALIALGYSKEDRVVKNGIKGLKSLACESHDQTMLQLTTAGVWNTALLSHALQSAGVSYNDPTVSKSLEYLVERQHEKYGDWKIRNPNVLPGGWGFSNINTINPDVDDTTAALRAIRRSAAKQADYKGSWYKGVNWVLSMQNDDGGWPAFEKNTDNEILTWLPIEGSEHVSIDPSSADLTGRTLEFLGRDIGLTVEHHQVKDAVAWLKENQEKDGSWYGRWGITYIYGTWAAVTGMKAVGVRSDDPSIGKGANWLLKIQNKDGGWGESCGSDVEKRYVSLRESTPVQTAWALDALIAVFDQPTDAINRGVACLLDLLQKRNWTYSYPNGGGLPGSFYFYYHSYNFIWPLVTLSHYMKKYQ